MSLRSAVADPETRRTLAIEAVDEARLAIRDMRGVTGLVVLAGFDTVQRIRPGFLQDNVFNLLPDWAEAIEPHWDAGEQAGDPRHHLVTNRLVVAEDLLAVSDAYVTRAADPTAVALYNRLRPRAADRVGPHMERLADFIARNTD